MLDALVVGAGPTGLTLAVELRRRGLDVRLIEKATTPPADHSRALAVQARTLEIFQHLGIVDEAHRRALSAAAINVVLPGGRTARVPLTGFEGLSTPYPEMLMLPQDQTELLLSERLEREHSHAERGVELIAVEQQPDRVRCELSGARREEVEARWVIGCDGAHSTVRRAAGIEFDGDTYDDHCLLGEVILDWSFPHGELYLSPARHGVLAAFPVPGDRRYRIICILPEAQLTGSGELSLETFSAVVQRLVPAPVRIERAIVLSRYRLHHRVARQFRDRRLFLAGDAAHIHSPAGGQGMNTGIQDAWNLGWKLAGVTHGQLPESVLDSYEAERRRIAVRLIDFTDSLFGMMAGHGMLPAALRMIAPRLAMRAFGWRALQRKVIGFISQLRVRYPDGSLVSQIGTAPAPTPRAGERAPDAELRLEGGTTTRLFSRLGTEPVLLAIAGADRAEALEAVRALGARHRLATLTAPSTDPIAGIYGEATALLIRPDGYIGIRTDPIDPPAMERELRRWFAS